MRDTLRQLWHWRTLTGVALGATGGVLYSIFVGCRSGCAITSSTVLSALVGALIGASLVWPAPRPRPDVPAPPAGP
jgi:hypothetical protein